MTDEDTPSSTGAHEGNEPAEPPWVADTVKAAFQNWLASALGTNQAVTRRAEIEAAGLSIDQVNAWLSGASFPKDAGVFAKLCCAVGKPPDRLLFGAGGFTDSSALVGRELGGLKASADIFAVVDRGLIRSGPTGLATSILSLMQRTTARITFLIPTDDVLAPPDRDSACQVLHDIRTHRCKAARIAPERLRWFMFDPAKLTVGRSTGVLAFLFEGPGESPDTTLQEVRAINLHPQVRDRANRWTKIWNEMGGELWREFRAALVPVRNPRFDDTRLQSRVRNAYEFIPGSYARYEALRELSLPTPPQLDPLKTHLPSRADDGRPIEIVDIGPGDLRTTEHMVLSTLNATGVNYRVLGLEPGVPDSDEELTQRLRLHRAHMVKTRFEDWDEVVAADLVTSFHSAYLIDCGHMAKVMTMLREGKKALVLLALHEDNIVAEIATAVDQWVAKGARPHWPEKAVTKNPYRVFAEDLDKWFQDHGLGPAVTRIPISAPVLLADLFRPDQDEDGGFRPTGKSIVEYFLGTRFEFRDWVETKPARALQQELRDRISRGDVSAIQKQQLFVIERQSVSDALLFDRDHETDSGDPAPKGTGSGGHAPTEGGHP